MFHEAVGGDDAHAAGLDVVLGRHAGDAAEMVAVAVRIDDGLHGFVADMLLQEGEGRAGDLDGGEGVDHDVALARVDERDGRHVEAADLIDVVGDLVEAVLGEQPCLAPEAWVGAGRGLCLQEVIGSEVEDDASAIVLDLRVVEGRDEAALGELEILGVVEGKLLADAVVELLCRGRGFGHDVLRDGRRRGAQQHRQDRAEHEGKADEERGCDRHAEAKAAQEMAGEKAFQEGHDGQPCVLWGQASAGVSRCNG